MLGAFWSEWVKLRRRAVLLWGLGGGVLFTVLITVFTFLRAQKSLSSFHGHGLRVTVAQLSAPDGLARGFVDAGALIGIVALCLFAGSTASEYSQRTLSNLLVRQPHRPVLLAGKFAALCSFIVVAIVLAFGVAGAVAFVIAPGKGIATSAWTSSAGLTDLGQSFLHVFLASIGYGLLGTGLAVILRSPGVSIGLGVAWILPAEAIITAIWSSGDRWLPGQLLQALIHGGNSSSSYGRSLLLLVLYAAVATAGTLTLFARRDV